MKVVLPEAVIISLSTPVQGRPFRLVLEQPHGFGVIVAVRSKAMIDPGRHDHEIVLVKLNAHPVVVLASAIKVPPTIEDISYLLVLVDVLVEEHLHFVFVGGTHLLWGDCDLVAVLVAALGGDFVDVGDVGVVVVEDA